MAADPFELWQRAGGGTRRYDAERYRELLREHGHIVPCRCSCHEDGSGHCEKCRPRLSCGWPGPQRPAEEWCIHEMPPGTCSFCTGRGEETPDKPDPAKWGPWFESRYPGKCAGCGEGWPAGDLIRSDGDGGWLCGNCGDDDG